MPQKTLLSSVYVEACKEDEFDEKPLWVNIAGPLLFQKVFTVLYMEFNKLLIRKYRSHRSDNDDVTPLNDSRNITNNIIFLSWFIFQGQRWEFPSKCQSKQRGLVSGLLSEGLH